ncbi:MAG: transposase [Nitrospirota bacterium]
MAYRKITSEFKLEVIKSYWVTPNVSQIARKYGIGRDAVYEWSNSARKAILESFADSTPGKRTVNLMEENKTLREQLMKLSAAYRNLSQKVGQSTFPSEVVLNCQKCSSENIWKNGKVYTKSYGLRQRISCRACSFSVYVALKKTV